MQEGDEDRGRWKRPWLRVDRDVKVMAEGLACHFFFSLLRSYDGPVTWSVFLGANEAEINR